MAGQAQAEAVGERVRRLRLEMGISQRELTAGLDRCSFAYLSRIEAGSRTPSAHALAELAGRLDTTALYLATGDADGVCPYCGRNKKTGRIRLNRLG